MAGGPDSLHFLHKYSQLNDNIEYAVTKHFKVEIEILPTSKFADKKINELDLPKAVIIGGIVRKENVIFPDNQTTLQINDKIVLFTDQKSIKEVEKLSEVNIEFF